MHRSCHLSSHLSWLPSQSKGQRLLRLIKPYAIWAPPHSHFHLTVLSAHASTVLIYSTQLGIQATLQTCQVPVRGSFPQKCLPPGIPSPHISARPIQTFTPFRLFSWGYLITRSPPTVLFTFTMSHTACRPCSRLPVVTGGPEIPFCLYSEVGSQEANRKLSNKLKMEYVSHYWLTEFLKSSFYSQIPTPVFLEW